MVQKLQHKTQFFAISCFWVSPSGILSSPLTKAWTRVNHVKKSQNLIIIRKTCLRTLLNSQICPWMCKSHAQRNVLPRFMAISFCRSLDKVVLSSTWYHLLWLETSCKPTKQVEWQITSLFSVYSALIGNSKISFSLQWLP